MTSTQFMQIVCFGAAALLCIALAGCASTLTQPVTLTAPYDSPQVWAVAPFNNESGVSSVQGDRVADMFVQQVQDVTGLNALPVNRVIAAMRALDMPRVSTEDDAAALLSELNVDGVIVGTVTAYDPYRPMTLGAAIELHVAESQIAQRHFDTRSLTRNTGDTVAPAEFSASNPVAQAAGVFDARNHETLAWLSHYATGRSVPDSAYGKDVYLVRMDLYTQFVSYRLLHDLLNAEWSRRSPIVEESQQR